jgi:apolipoprotein N-acyltransferase
VFARDVNAAPGRPDLLLQVTNDAWFGTRVGPYQHLAQARMRAVEQGLPLARSANTGISAMIDPLGRIVASLPLGEAGHVDAMLPAPLPPTPYARTGDLPLLVLLLAALGVVWWRPVLRKPH